MNCPSCSATLVDHSHESVRVCTCPSDHGMFLPAEALRQAVADRAADRPDDEEQEAERVASSPSLEELESTDEPRSCPECGVAMSRRTYAYESGVPIDVCAEHGVWLDQGELQRIEAWYEAQERHLAKDRAEWGGPAGRLEQIEEQHERQAADDSGSVHWGPVGWFVRKLEYSWARRDDR